MGRHEQLRVRVKELAVISGYEHIYYTWNSRHSPAGFPDMLLLKGGRLIVIEFKIRPDNLSPEQYFWLMEFLNLTDEVYVFDDSDEDWEKIEALIWGAR